MSEMKKNIMHRIMLINIINADIFGVVELIIMRIQKSFIRGRNSNFITYSIFINF